VTGVDGDDGRDRLEEEAGILITLLSERTLQNFDFFADESVNQ
jgi:hypothetical protein